MNTTLLLKTDKVLKEEASRTARELGVPLTTVINAYLRQFVRDRRISLSVEPQLSQKKIKEILAISAEMDANIKNQKVFTNVNDLFKHLKLPV